MATQNARIKTLLKAIVVTLLVSAVFAGLYFMVPKATPMPPKTQISLTQTPDFNTCNVIKTDDIKAVVHGDLITNSSQGVRVGVNAPNDTIADSCGFTLETAKSPNNSLSVQVYPYTATIDGVNKEAVGDAWSEVASSDPKAYFNKSTNDDTVVYKLRVIPGGKNVMFELRQPKNAAAIDEASALDFLVDLANKADLTVIDQAAEF